MTALDTRNPWALLSFSILTALGGCRLDSPTVAQDTPNRTSAPAIRVSVAEARRVDMAAPIRVAGMLVNETESSAAFAVGGVVARIDVREGDHVVRGRPLARLELGAVDAQMSGASAALERAERNLARTEWLASTGAAPTHLVDEAHTDVAVNRAAVSAASFVRRHAVLTAARDGIVVRRLADPGETVAAGMPILVLTYSANGIRFRVALTDRDFVRIRVGDAARVELDAIAGRTLDGRVERISASADPATGLYEVELSVDGLDSSDFPVAAGLLGHASITASRGDDVTLVPSEALVEADGDEASLWALAPDARHVARKTVHVAFFDGGFVAIREALDGSSQVVTAGAPYLRESSTVEVVPASAGAREVTR